MSATIRRKFAARLRNPLALAFAMLAAGSARGELSEAEFLDPPLAARPGALWSWMNGHVDHAEITRELEEMKAKGMRGAIIWDIGTLIDPEKTIPAGPRFLGPESLAAIHHAMDEAGRCRDCALGKIAVPDHMQVDPSAMHNAIIGLDEVAARVAIMLSTVQRLMQITDEMDKQRKRCDPLTLRHGMVLQQPDLTLNLIRDAIAVRTRCLEIERLADVDILIVPGTLIAETIRHGLDAVSPDGCLLNRLGRASRRFQHGLMSKQMADRAARCGLHIGQRNFAYCFMTISPPGHGWRGPGKGQEQSDPAENTSRESSHRPER